MEHRNQRAESAERSGAGSARGAARGGNPHRAPWPHEAESLPETHPTRPAAGRRMVAPEARAKHRTFTPNQRLLILDTWMRSGLAATVFSEICGVGPSTLGKWRSRFEEEGPAGLDERRRGAPKGSRLPEPTRRAILMLKSAHPEWGSDRIHDMLLRSEGFRASAGAIRRLLAEEGFVVEESTKPRHEPDRVRRFERARPNQLWQSDLFTFTLKRENRRVHLAAFLDDHSRFVVGWSLSASSSGVMVRGALEDAIANYGAPEEVLTDRGPQYHTWRGKSAFAKLLERRGIKQILARPRHPQTLGKTERFWGSLWREFLQAAIFRGLDDARRRIGLYVDHYNFFRPHQGLGGGAVPADRFFEASPEVKRALLERVDQNALDLARHGETRKPVYLTGRVGDRSVTLHAEGERVILQSSDGTREEVDLAAPGRRSGEEAQSLLPANEPEEEATEDDIVEPDIEPDDEPSTGASGPDDEPPPPAPPGTSALDAMLREFDAGRGQ